MLAVVCSDASARLPDAFQPARGIKEIWRRPLPHLADQRLTRWLCRILARLAAREVLSLEGLGAIGVERDPFLLAANHSQRRETLWLAGLLGLHRGGRLLRFLAHWSWSLVPGGGLLYRRSGAILVRSRGARIAAFNRWRPSGTPTSAFDAARDALARGESVALFPEGKMNRDPHRLLRGQRGCARLAIGCERPVVPVGIRFPEHRSAEPIRDGERMSIHIGEPLWPPRGGDAEAATVAAFHAEIMQAIARLSGKTWLPEAPRRHFDEPRTER